MYTKLAQRGGAAACVCVCDQSNHPLHQVKVWKHQVPSLYTTFPLFFKLTFIVKFAFIMNGSGISFHFRTALSAIIVTIRNSGLKRE